MDQLKVQESYRKKIRDSYTFHDSSSSKEEAIYNFLKSISIGNPNLYSCTEHEIKEIFLPNSVDEKTITSFMEPDKAWELINSRRGNALVTLEKLLKGKSFVIKQINWKRLDRQLNRLNSHQIGNIIIKIDNTLHTIEEVKLVVQFENQYKVCVFAK